MKRTKLGHSKKSSAKHSLSLPDLDQARSAVLNSLPSKESQRGYRDAIDEFITWYCSGPRLSFNKAVVTRYRIHLESRQLAPGTIKRRETAIDPKVLARFVGAYQLTSGGRLLITMEGNHLFGTPERQAPVSFFPESETVFFQKGADVQIEFPIDAATSPASQLIFNQSERATTAKRLDEAEFRRLSDVATAAAKDTESRNRFRGAKLPSGS